MESVGADYSSLQADSRTRTLGLVPRSGCLVLIYMHQMNCVNPRNNRNHCP